MSQLWRKRVTWVWIHLTTHVLRRAFCLLAFTKSYQIGAIVGWSVSPSVRFLNTQSLLAFQIQFPTLSSNYETMIFFWSLSSEHWAVSLDRLVTVSNNLSGGSEKNLVDIKLKQENWFCLKWNSLLHLHLRWKINRDDILKAGNPISKSDRCREMFFPSLKIKCHYLWFK